MSERPPVTYIVYVAPSRADMFRALVKRHRLQFHVPDHQLSEQSTRVYLESDLSEQIRDEFLAVGLTCKRNEVFATPRGAAS